MSYAEVTVKPRICLSNLQTLALLNLLDVEKAASCSIDITDRNEDRRHIYVTIYRDGDHCVFSIHLDGTTAEVADAEKA